ncbi:MAG: hypothetical protein L0Y36_08495 [Planctomycetales bacterium]|nr:hypothetical protein [Planctomycetales bacterium]
MFWRIFGIGRKKDHFSADVSASGAGVALRDHFSVSHETPGTAVVPLRSGESVIPKKKDPAEVFNEAVNRLVEQLQGINDNLDQHIRQNQHLVQQMNTLPEMLRPLPGALEEQRQAFGLVAEQLRQKAARDEKVADELAGIHQKVAASTEMDARMCEHLGKLDKDTVTQTEWIQQMSRTFSASERFMKYTLARQQIRFYWVFGISLGVCFFAIVGLLVGIVLLVQG